MSANTTVPAIDLSVTFPRSPREKIGAYVIAARTLDKCRAAIAGTLGEYHYDCPLDNIFFDFAGITGDDFKAFVATGADDEAVGAWLEKNGKPTKQEIIQWNNDMRYKRISEMPMKLQEFLEGYIPEFVTPKGKIVYVWFDVYDIEEGRI